jgi:hypothetical protein
MSQATAMFRSQLREAVRESQAPPPGAVVARPTPPKRVHRTKIRLWLPLSPLWLILSPFPILLAPLLWLAPQTRGVRPFRAVFAMGAVLFALSGTVVDVDTPDALVQIHIL